MLRTGYSYLNSHAYAKADEQEQVQTDATAEQHGCFYAAGVKYIFKGEQETAFGSTYGAGSRNGRSGYRKDRLAGNQFTNGKIVISQRAVGAVGNRRESSHLQKRGQQNTEKK